MKGLLIKDFKLMKSQKNFFILLILISIAMAAFSFPDSAFFIIGFMAFVGSLFAMSSVSYDEFDNGNAFLFSLPITRKQYVKEKYVFGLITGGVSWLIAVVIAAAAVLANSYAFALEDLIIAAMLLPIMAIILSIMLPLQLKFGAEKGRIAFICVMVILALIGAAIVKIADSIGFDPFSVFANLPYTNVALTLLIEFAAAAIVVLISCKISMGIINKKEF